MLAYAGAILVPTAYKKQTKFAFPDNTTAPIYRIYTMLHKSYTGRDTRQNQCYLPRIKANRPNLPQQCLGCGDISRWTQMRCSWVWVSKVWPVRIRGYLTVSLLQHLPACLDAILMKNIGIEGSDIHGNEEGVGWKWGLCILFPQEICCILQIGRQILNMKLQMQIHKLWYVFQGVVIGRNYVTAKLAAFVYFVEEKESTCFGLVNMQAISILLAYMAFIVHSTDHFCDFPNHSVSWTYLPYLLVKKHSFWRIFLSVKALWRIEIRCIHSVYGHSGVDRKGKLFVRCVYVDVDKKVKCVFFLFVRCVYHSIYAFQIHKRYINALSYQVAAG